MRKIHAFLAEIQASLRVNGLKLWEKACLDPEIAALHDVWIREFPDTTHHWLDVFSKLHEAAAPITVVTVNSQSSGVLNYADHVEGMSVIAIGGYSLSRGLTLEGLMVSYFLRNSIMYDTLMQMGRWFGYRPGYEDLCRIWMTSEAEEWYAHISESIEELRDELRSMQAANATPKEFGLRVRSHPDTLIVTARNKMGSGQTFKWTVKLANRLIETSTLKSSPQSTDHNKKVARQLVSGVKNATGKDLNEYNIGDQGWLIPAIPAGLVTEFLRGFQNHPQSSIAEPGPVIRYIEDRILEELSRWDLYIPSVRTNGEAFLDNCLGIDIYCQRRTKGAAVGRDVLLVGDNGRVSSRGIEKMGLTPGEIVQAEAQYKTLTATNGRAARPSYPDRIYRAVRTVPLLAVHLLGIVPKGQENHPERTVVAWSISFPKTSQGERGTEYVVNTVFYRDMYLEEVNEEDMDGDEVQF